MLGELADLAHVVVVAEAEGETGAGLAAVREAAAGQTVHTWDEVLAADPVAPDVDIRPGDLATFIYTGGTTGPSKGCMLSHHYHGALASQIGICWRRTADDVVWTPLPLFHFNAISTAVVGPLVFGGRAAIYSRFSVSNFWPEMNRVGATVTSTLGTMAYLLAHDVDRPEMPRSGAPEANTSLRLLGAAPMPVEVESVIKERFGLTTFSGAYGVTEASLVSWQPPGIDNRPNAAGVINDEYFDVRIFDDDDHELPRRHRRRDRVAAQAPPRHVRGLLGQPRGHRGHQPQLVVPHRRHRSGRRRRLPLLRRPQGRLPAPAGREHLQLRGGAHPDGPRQAGRRGRARGGQRADRGRPQDHRHRGRGRGRSSPDELFRWCIDELPYFVLPRYIEFRAELPRSPVGRVLKRELRDEGVTPATWDAETSGITYEKR